MRATDVTEVIPLGAHYVYLKFFNNEERILDVTPYMCGGWYEPLENPEYFKTVHVANYTIEWADGQDIAPHELYELSVPISMYAGRVS
jgi:hypothetical protein